MIRWYSFQLTIEPDYILQFLSTISNTYLNTSKQNEQPCRNGNIDEPQLNLKHKILDYAQRLHPQLLPYKILTKAAF